MTETRRIYIIINIPEDSEASEDYYLSLLEDYSIEVFLFKTDPIQTETTTPYTTKTSNFAPDLETIIDLGSDAEWAEAFAVKISKKFQDVVSWASPVQRLSPPSDTEVIVNVEDLVLRTNIDSVHVNTGLEQDNESSEETILSPDNTGKSSDGSSEYLPFPTATFNRKGKFITFSGKGINFAGSRLSFDIVNTDKKRDAVRDIFEMHSEVLSNKMRRVDSQNDLIDRLSSFSLESASLSHSGEFGMSRTRNRDYWSAHPENGWIWVLNAKQTFVGFLKDSSLEQIIRNNVIIYLPETVNNFGQNIPIDPDEQTILENPEVFADNPGSSCAPFSSPNRILTERRFYTILRTGEDPQIDPHGYNRNFLDGREEDPEIVGTHLQNESTKFYSPLPENTAENGYIDPRIETSYTRPIDWERDPRLNQPFSITIGHMLDWRVRYRSNGYSLGNIEHTLTLAPRQARRIKRVQWNRSEEGSREEDQGFSESVADALDRSYDYLNAVEAQFDEWAQGSSYSRTSSKSGGLGLGASFKGISAVIGGSGGSSFTTSSAQQTGERNSSAREEQKLRDAVRRFGESVRELRSTIVEEATQGEAAEGSTEVVRNINYCHSLTVIYYQILRHLRVDTDLAGVSECLFVPFLIKPFDLQRILKWKDTLSKNVPRRFKYVFDHLKALESGNPKDAGLPNMERAYTHLDIIKGEIFIELVIERPKETQVITLESFKTNEKYQRALIRRVQLESDMSWQEAKTAVHGVLDMTSGDSDDAPDDVIVHNPLSVLLSGRLESIVDSEVFNEDTWRGVVPGQPVHQVMQTMADLPPSERDAYFQRHYAPIIARHYCNKLLLMLGNVDSHSYYDFDMTMASPYISGRPIKVSFRSTKPFNSLDDGYHINKRSEMRYARVRGMAPLPESSSAKVLHSSFTILGESYRSRLYLSFDQDIEYATEIPNRTGSTDRYFPPLTPYDKVNPWQKLKDDFRGLVSYLNEHAFRYHKLIWFSMSRDELYTTLEGYKLDIDGSPAITSIIEAEPIAVVGNMLVFPVSKGVFIGTKDFKDPEELKKFYQDQRVPSDPMRISLPTGGLYSRAIKDSCTATEEHRGSLDWVLENYEPQLGELPDNLLASRYSQPQGLEPSKLPSPLVNLHDVPGAPAPTGTKGVLDAVSSSGGFQDMAGLAGTQDNTMQALKSSMELSGSLGKKAGDMASFLKQMQATNSIHQKREVIQRMLKDGLIEKDDAQRLAEKALGEVASGPGKKDEGAAETLKGALSSLKNKGGTSRSGKGSISATFVKPDGTTESVLVDTRTKAHETQNTPLFKEDSSGHGGHDHDGHDHDEHDHDDGIEERDYDSGVEINPLSLQRSLVYGMELPTTADERVDGRPKKVEMTLAELELLYHTKNNLHALGFWMVGEQDQKLPSDEAKKREFLLKNVTFDLATERAIREFQLYAKLSVNDGLWEGVCMNGIARQKEGASFSYYELKRKLEEGVAKKIKEKEFKNNDKRIDLFDFSQDPAAPDRYVDTLEYEDYLYLVTSEQVAPNNLIQNILGGG